MLMRSGNQVCCWLPVVDDGASSEEGFAAVRVVGLPRENGVVRIVQQAFVHVAEAFALLDAVDAGEKPLARSLFFLLEPGLFGTELCPARVVFRYLVGRHVSDLLGRELGHLLLFFRLGGGTGRGGEEGNRAGGNDQEREF